jgi:hypothetical protein
MNVESHKRLRIISSATGCAECFISHGSPHQWMRLGFAELTDARYVGYDSRKNLITS